MKSECCWSFSSALEVGFSVSTTVISQLSYPHWNMRGTFDCGFDSSRVPVVCVRWIALSLVRTSFGSSSSDWHAWSVNATAERSVHVSVQATELRNHWSIRKGSYFKSSTEASRAFGVWAESRRCTSMEWLK